MIEIGKVIEIKGKTAKVQLESKSQCSSCAMAGVCELVGEGKRYIEVEKMATTRVGDKVRVEIKEGQLLKGTVLLFLIPAFSFVVGAAIGQALMEGIVFSLILGIAFLAITFFFLHLLDKRLGKGKNRPRIISTIT